ncbi:MAG: magnesium/cobalt transporter CorA [candidate division NC10 bacterium]|nr:magnesium/cobalt transporter CorA [candidate division NC10 bacterium]
MGTTVCYLVRGNGELAVDPPEEVLQAGIASPTDFVWMDVEAPGDAEYARLKHLYGFHDLALEDCANPETRTKLEAYDGTVFLVCRGVNHAPGGEEVDTVPLFCFLGDTYLVTLHPFPVRSVGAVCDRLRKNPRLLLEGPDRVLHLLIDHLVDHYFPLLDAIDERLDRVEDEIFREASRDALPLIFRTKKEVLALRRSAAPLRDILGVLANRGIPHVRAGTQLYFRDVHDHTLRIAETLDSYRDMLTSSLESYLSQVSNRLNDIMKRLTIVATILLPLTFITGLFGMNFEELPLTRGPVGFWLVAGGMGLLAVVLALYFKRKDWW